MKNMDKEKMIHAVKFSALLLLIMMGVFLAVKYAPYIINLAKDPEDLKDMLDSYGVMGIVIFIIIQVIQVIIAFLPGDVTQVAGGYLYGTTLGTIYSMAGITLGSVIVFFTARLLGYSLINMLISKELFEKFSFLINSPKSEMAMFIIFLIPGMPKDFLSYLAGITPVKPVNFLVISTIARFPALFISSYIGANLQQGNLTAVIVVVIISCLLMAAGFFMKDRILGFLHKDVAKKNKPLLENQSE